MFISRNTKERQEEYSAQRREEQGVIKLVCKPMTKAAYFTEERMRENKFKLYPEGLI